jgi:hypothetical protein
MSRQTRTIFTALLVSMAAGTTCLAQRPSAAPAGASNTPTSTASFVTPNGTVVAPTVQASDPARAQVAAATANAMSALRNDIASARITPSLTVGQFLEQTNSMDALNDTIARAQQIGGPRWIDDQTCQVRLEISGMRVVYTLRSIANIRANLSPIPAAALEQRLADWRNRTFSATGTAIAAERIQGIRPSDAAVPWASVSDDARSKAVAAARQDAARHVIDSIRPIQFGNSGETMGDVLSREPVQHAVEKWLATRPVTQVRFNDDLQVELTVSAPPEDLLDTVITSAKDLPDSKVPTDQQTIEQLRQEFSRHVSAAIGRADVNKLPRESGTTQLVPFALPEQPPTWVGQLMQADGVSDRAGSPLKTARAAEAKANDTLRSRIGVLQISPSLTIDQAAKQDPAINEAINRALLRAHVDKVDYRADGSVMTRMTADTRDVWYELQQLAGR